MKWTYVGPINKTGYGVASTSYLNQLAKLNPELSVVPIGPVSNEELNPEARKALDTTPDYSAPVFVFWHIFDLLKQVEKFTGKKIAFSTFELNTLSPPEISALSAFDRIGTASTWGEKILKQLNIPTFVAPHAFKDTPTSVLPNYAYGDSTVWHNLLSPCNLSKDIILSTAGKWEKRKGYPELVDALIDIGQEHDVTLIAFCHNPFIPDSYPYSFIHYRNMFPVYTSSGIKVYRKNKFKLVLMPPAATRTELHSVMFKSSFFVSPSRGEGWNLPLFEMMSLGMPCIHTLNTAHSDYCVSDELTIADEGLESAYDGQFFHGTSTWSKVTKEGIKKVILKAITDPSLRSYNNLTSKFSWEESAKLIQQQITQL